MKTNDHIQNYFRLESNIDSNNNLKFAKFYLIRIHKRISIKIPFDKYIVQIYIQE